MGCYKCLRPAVILLDKTFCCVKGHELVKSGPLRQRECNFKSVIDRTGTFHKIK